MAALIVIESDTPPPEPCSGHEGSCGVEGRRTLAEIAQRVDAAGTS